MTDAVRNVSGTAYWIAHQRAREMQREAPVFRDPWATELAGERGPQVMKQLGWWASFSTWANIARTVILDQRVLERVNQDGVDTVLNLGAGLDTRAFRLELPARLRWFDVDMPEILEYKSSVLRAATAPCQYEAIAADLSDGNLRRDIIERVARAGSKALVVTEGVLEYLSEEAVQSLALELRETPAYRFWLTNMMSPTSLRQIKSLGTRLARANAPLVFAPAKGSKFFAPFGWQEMEWVSLLTEARRINRLPLLLRPSLALLAMAGPTISEKYHRAQGVACLARAQ